MHGVKWNVIYGAALVKLAFASPIARLVDARPFAQNHELINSSVPSTTVNDILYVTRRAPGAGPSPYPYGTPWTNEMSWKGWDSNNGGADRVQGQHIHDTYSAVKAMTVYAWHEADGKTATFKRWFSESDADNVKKVLEQIMDMNSLIPEALPQMKDRVLDRADYKSKCIKSTSLNAYTTRKTGRRHVCPHGLSKPNLATLTCDKLDG